MDIKDTLISAAATTAMEKILGPFIDHMLMLSKEAINEYRRNNLLIILKLGAKMLEDADAEPGQASGRVVLPMLEAASVEDNKDMQEMWAALFAHSALPGSVRPILVDILRKLAPDEARMVDWIYRTMFQRGGMATAGNPVVLSITDLIAAYRELGYAQDDTDNAAPATLPTGFAGLSNRTAELCINCLDTLVSQGLLYKLDSVALMSPSLPNNGKYCATYRGYEFFAAVTPPKLKAPLNY